MTFYSIFYDFHPFFPFDLFFFVLCLSLSLSPFLSIYFSIHLYFCFVECLFVCFFIVSSLFLYHSLFLSLSFSLFLSLSLFLSISPYFSLLFYFSEIANLIRQQVTQFRPEIPLLVILRNPGMRDRHWEKVSTYLTASIY